ILLGQSSQQMDQVFPVLSLEELISMQNEVTEVFADTALCEYIVELVEKTRSNEYISQGISPRGSIALLKMAKAYAFYHSRNYIVPEDIHAVFYSVCNHRIILGTKAKAVGKEATDILMDIIDSVPIPKI
ncbi:MAG: hypothetical protein IIV45_18380, partial [Lachnospiraceae bacterium]|nr:hypothetical protein [Lachnospiraceae bacterium]